ncbi:MAG: OmpA family protein, partial [Bacteroidota bacterium]
GDGLNTKYDEMAPVPSPNFTSKLYFSSNRPGSLGGLRDDRGMKDSKYGSYNTDMYSVALSNGEWSTVEAANSISNSPKNEVLLDFNGSGSVMFYLKYFDQNKSDIYVDTFANENGNQVKFYSRFDSENGDHSLSFFGDTVFLFASQRPGGYGGYDLYITSFTNDAWSAPKNLGPKINSEYDEINPFLSKNGRTLFYSSNNLKSMGGHDIFQANFDEERAVWNTPKNIGLPINSPADDQYIKIAKDGMSAFFSSSRKEGYGNQDLYIAYFKNEIGSQSGVSNPVHFALVEPPQDEFEGDVVKVNSNQTTEIKEYFLNPLYYDDRDMIIDPVNKKHLENWSKLLLIYPTLKLEIQSHAIETGPDLFDLYFSMKRAEKVKDFLISQGVRPTQLVLRAFGASYPFIRKEMNGNDVPLARKLNRRIDFRPINAEANNVKIELQSEPVPDNFKTNSFDDYTKKTKGLSYNIQITETRQLYNNKLLEKYSHISIEQLYSSDAYKYVVGIYSNFYSAERVRQELFVKGLYEAAVIPYINGIRITRSDAPNYFDQYPDLKRFYEKTK